MQPQAVLRVKNGFVPDWMPGGYRDVKVNPVLNDHLCEIQLHLSKFVEETDGQHDVYEWARKLKVTQEMRPTHFFKNLSPEVTKEMVLLARNNWLGSGPWLLALQFDAGQFNLVEEPIRQVRCIRIQLKPCLVLAHHISSVEDVSKSPRRRSTCRMTKPMRTVCSTYMHQALSKAEDCVKRGPKDNHIEELRVSTLTATLGMALQKQVRHEQFNAFRMARIQCLAGSYPTYRCGLEAGTFGVIWFRTGYINMPSRSIRQTTFS